MLPPPFAHKIVFATTGSRHKSNHTVGLAVVLEDAKAEK
jgi:hypothetical protein